MAGFLNPGSRSGRAKRGRPSSSGSNPATLALASLRSASRAWRSSQTLRVCSVPPRPCNRNSAGSGSIRHYLSRNGGFAFVQSLNAGCGVL